LSENTHEYRFSNALSYTFEQLAEMHNTSFSGYYVPLDMTPTQVSDFWRVNQIDATRCVVMHDAHGAFVGMARMGTRATHSWCGGFGIAPAFRGAGAGKLLADEMVRVARETGLTQLQLEVNTQNIPAIKCYEHAGFVAHRRLFGLEIATSVLPAKSAPSLPVKKVPLETILSWYSQHSEQPYWGRELASILTMGAEALVITGPDGSQNTFVVQRVDDKASIQAVLLQSQLTDDELSTMLHAVAADAAQIQIVNEPEESTLLTRYTGLGFTESFSQYEMTLDL